MKIYMFVTKDKYELPLIVADSPDELARKLGIKPNLVSSSISRSARFGYQSQYVCVEVEDENSIG